MGVEDAVGEVGGFSPAMLVALGEKGVKSLDDLADLASDELIEILGAEAVDEETANAVILAARQSAGWFGDEDVAGAATGTGGEAEGDGEAVEAGEQDDGRGA
jgi:N utilization substance protein A